METLDCILQERGPVVMPPQAQPFLLLLFLFACVPNGVWGLSRNATYIMRRLETNILDKLSVV